jgi:hypothetical protein
MTIIRLERINEPDGSVKRVELSFRYSTYMLKAEEIGRLAAWIEDLFPEEFEQRRTYLAEPALVREVER